MRQAALAATAALFLIGAAIGSPSASATSPSALTAARFVADLNAKREANGLPPVIENPTWSSWCLAHLDYLALNPSVWGSAWPGPHEETPGKPGYSKEGALGGNGVLAGVYDSTTDVWGSNPWQNPWEDAPAHLKDLLDGHLDEVGFAFAHGYMCAWAGSEYSPGYLDHGASHDQDIVYTYPGDGTRGIYPSEDASEEPATPAELVGLKTQPTGPYILVTLDGPWLDQTESPLLISSASLVGPAGPVTLRVISSADMPPGYDFMVGAWNAFLLPLHSLRPGTQYTATISGTFGPNAIAHTWSFTTGGSPSSGTSTVDASHAAPTASTSGLLSVTQPTYHGTTVSISLRARAALIGRRATVTTVANFRGGCGAPCGGWPRSRNSHTSVRLAAGQRFTLPFQKGGGWSGVLIAHVAAFTYRSKHYGATNFQRAWGR